MNEIKLRQLAANLGNEWKSLATHLGVRRDEVDRIQIDNPTTEEQIFKMLMTWWQRWDKDIGRCNTVDALCDSLVKIGRQDLVEYFAELGPVTHLVDFNVDVCRAEFIRYYKDTMGVVPLLPWLPSEVSKINDIYVKPRLVEKEVKGEKAPHHEIDSYEDMLRLESPDGQPVRFILLSGLAGSGKTTIVSKIANDWALEKPGSPLSKFKLCVALSLRELKSISDLTEAIFDQILPRDTRVSRESLKNYLKSHAEEVLVLLDGADEFDKEGSQLPSEGDVIDIISNKILRGCTVIVTTRPHMVDKLCGFNPGFTRIKCNGFSNGGVKEYIQRFFKSEDPRDSAELHRHLVESESLHNLARTPMMLLLMCLIWSEEYNLPQTLTELFQEAAFFILKRHFQNSGNICQEEEELLKNELIELVQALGKAALDGLMLPGQKLVFQTSDFGNAQEVHKACSLGFLTQERVRSKLQAVDHVTFLHKTFQEAIAGFYWASLAESDDQDSFNHYCSQIHEGNAFTLEYVLRFCCGAAKRPNVKAARSLLIHIAEVFSVKEPESVVLEERKYVPESIIYKSLSIKAKRERRIKRLWLLMHLEAQSEKLYSIAIPLFEHRLEFNFDCAEDLRVAFGFLVQCASKPSVEQSFLAEIKQVTLSTVNENSAPITVSILKCGANVTDVGLVFGRCKNEGIEPRWQVDLGEELGKMHLENLSLSGPFASRNQDISAIFKSISQPYGFTSLQRLALDLVAVNPRYLKKFLEMQGRLCQIALHFQHGNDSPPVWSEALEGLQRQSLAVLDVRHYKTGSRAYCLGKSFPNLQVLRLIDDGLQVEDFHRVCDLLSEASQLQEVDLSRNEIGHGFSRLVEQLGKLDHLEVLKLTDTGLTSDQVVILARNLPRMANLRILSLSRYEYSPNSLTPEAFLTIVQLASESSSLRHLDIKQCVPENHGKDASDTAEGSDDGFLTGEDPAQETHHQSTIENLDSSSNHLGICTVKFMKLLKQMPSLKNLDMSQMSLTDSDAVVLAEVLQGCQKLQKVHLGANNKMGNGGLEAILMVLPKLPALEYLSLPESCNEPTDGIVRECLKYAQRYSVMTYFYEFNRPQIEAAVEVVQWCRAGEDQVASEMQLCKS